jgi:hypothetical protein
MELQRRRRRRKKKKKRQSKFTSSNSKRQMRYRPFIFYDTERISKLCRKKKNKKEQLSVYDSVFF